VQLFKQILKHLFLGIVLRVNIFFGVNKNYFPLSSVILTKQIYLSMTMIRTNEPDWLSKALEAYKAKLEFTLIDDGDLGLEPNDVKSAVNLLRFVKKKKVITWRKMVKVLTSLGITGVGVWIIAAAIADPEPTSKLSLLITGGLVLTLTGSLSILASLGIKYAVSAKAFGKEFQIRPF